MKKDIRNVKKDELPIDPVRESLKKITLRPNGRKRVQTVPIGDSLTQQQFAKQCDINNIMAAVAKTGQLPQDIIRDGIYSDVSLTPDNLLSAYQTVQNATDAFMQLPPEIRLKVDNDPTKLVAYLQDPKNDDEAVRLGLKNPKKDPPPAPAPASPPPPKPPEA